MKTFNLGFLYTFSFLAAVSNWLPIRGKLQSAVYAASILSLIGFSIIVALKPKWIFQKYGATFQEVVYTLLRPFVNVSREKVNVYANIYTIHLIGFGFHILPVYVFRKRWTRHLESPIPLLVIYAILFFPWIERIYPLPISKLIVVALLSWAICMMGNPRFPYDSL